MALAPQPSLDATLDEGKANAVRQPWTDEVSGGCAERGGIPFLA